MSEQFHPSRLSQMEADAAAVLDANARKRELEGRATSPAVQALNDRAQLEIYGSGNHTWHNPETNEVIASPASPMSGKLEQIKSDRGYGTSEAERERAASKYEASLNELLADGFELSQAKLVMDLREKDQDKIGQLAGKYISDGENPLVAKKKAKTLYDKLDAKRLDLIKNKGAFTEEEYKLLRAGRNWNVDASNGGSAGADGGDSGRGREELDNPIVQPEASGENNDEPEETEAERTRREFEEQIEAYRGNLSAEFMYDYAMTEKRLTELMARRERVQGVALKHTKKELAEAQDEFEQLRRQAKVISAEAMAEAGLSQATFLIHSQLDDETENRYLALNTAAIRQDLAKPKGEGRRAELTQKFYDWWVRQGNGAEMSKKQKLFGHLKKAGAIAAVTVPVGIVAGLFLPVTAGAGIGAAVAFAGARSIGRGLASGRIEQNARESSGERARSLSDVEANSGNLAVRQALDRMHTQRGAIRTAYDNNGESSAAASISGAYVEGANKGAFANRRRLVGATVLGAAFGAAGAEVGNLIHDATFGGGHHNTGGNNNGHNGNGNGQGPRQNHRVNTHPHKPEHGGTGQELHVEHGSGEIREISEYAHSHNYNVSPQQASHIYEQLFHQHGSHIINLTGSGPDTYTISPGNVGLSHAGTAHWYPGVEHHLRHMLEEASKSKH